MDAFLKRCKRPTTRRGELPPPDIAVGEWSLRTLTAVPARGVRPDADSHQASGRSSPVGRDLPQEAAPTR